MHRFLVCSCASLPPFYFHYSSLSSLNLSNPLSLSLSLSLFFLYLSWPLQVAPLVVHASSCGGSVQLTAFLRLISARSKARLGLPQFTRCLVPAMCPSCCCMCRWLIAVRPSSPSLMKLKPGLEIPSMAASPTSSPCSSRYPSSSFTPLFYIQYPFLSLTPLPHHYPIKISPYGHIYFLHEKNIYKTFFFFFFCDSSIHITDLFFFVCVFLFNR